MVPVSVNRHPCLFSLDISGNCIGLEAGAALIFGLNGRTKSHGSGGSDGGSGGGSDAGSEVSDGSSTGSGRRSKHNNGSMSSRSGASGTTTSSNVPKATGCKLSELCMVGDIYSALNK